MDRRDWPKYHWMGDRSGFTLIELLITMAIIAILAAIAVPMYLGQKAKAVRQEAETNLQILRTLEENYYAENGRYAPPNDGDKLEFYGTYSTVESPNGIEDVLRSFKPGKLDELNFRYYLTTTDGTDFIANAVGRSSTQGAGMYLAIDQDNEWHTN